MKKIPKISRKGKGCFQWDKRADFNIDYVCNPCKRHILSNIDIRRYLCHHLQCDCPVTAELSFRNVYFNIQERIKAHMHLTDKENAASKACNGVFVFEYIPVGSMEFIAYLPAGLAGEFAEEAQRGEQ